MNNDIFFNFGNTYGDICYNATSYPPYMDVFFKERGQ